MSRNIYEIALGWTYYAFREEVAPVVNRRPGLARRYGNGPSRYSIERRIDTVTPPFRTSNAMKTVETTVETAAEGYLLTLAENGVSYVFGSPGSEDVHYWRQFDARGSELPEYVQCRHEQVAVDMARGYAWMTGEPQCVKLHGTLGTLNGALGIWGAYYAGTPMVVLSAHVRDHDSGVGQYQLDFRHPGGHERVLAPFCKWCDSIATNDEAGRYLCRAVALAEQRPAGPTFLNVPKELPGRSPDRFTVAIKSPSGVATPDASTLGRIAAELERSANPVVVTADLGPGTDGRAALVDLAERLSMPVYEAPKLRNTFPMDHPLYAGSTAYGVGGQCPPYEREAVDTVLVVGSALPWYPPQNGGPDATIVHVGDDVTQTRRSQWGYDADLIVEGDPAATLRELAAAVDAPATDRSIDWPAAHEAWRARWRAAATERPDGVVDPVWFTQELDDRLPDDSVIVNETIDHGSIVTNCLGDGTDRRFVSAERLTAGGLGSGIGLALGAKLAMPDRLVVALVGDGAYNYNPVHASYGAAAEHDLPVLVVVFDNGGYRVMERAYETAYPDEPSPDIGLAPAPRYTEQASAWGFHAERVDDRKSAASAVTRALDAVETGTSALLHVSVPIGE